MLAEISASLAVGPEATSPSKASLLMDTAVAAAAELPAAALDAADDPAPAFDEEAGAPEPPQPANAPAVNVATSKS